MNWEEILEIEDPERATEVLIDKLQTYVKTQPIK